MEGGRKFLRYIVPAFVYFIELILFLVIFSILYSGVGSDFKPLWDYLFNDKQGLSIIVSGLIISGGLGAIFCQVYHGFYSFYPVNLRELILGAIDKNHLKVTMNGNELSIERIKSLKRK